ncbi:uncharacterized protein LOC141907971 isoform X2 [Tubulanus polymorphus]
MTKNDKLTAIVKWYYRPSEVPVSVYQPLVQDRNHEYDSGRSLIIHDPLIKVRELFISDATDCYPINSIKGKCKVVHFQDIVAAQEFEPLPDTFFYIFGYNPETKRLATTQGEIRVGPSHQARLPTCQPDMHPDDMPEDSKEWEKLQWRADSVMDGDLMMFLRAARSMAAYAGMCNGGSTEEGFIAASLDETTVNALNTLHGSNYDTGKALQALVKCPVPVSIEKKWTEEETKRFVKGLRQYGKNFFKIHKELLSHKQTRELVEYYYYWKKTPAATSARPHRRHRRQSVFRRQRPPQRPASNDFLDLSSASEPSDQDSADDSDISGYACRHCFTTTSKDWHHAGKDKSILCTECRLYFKKYGEDRPLDKTKEPAPFLFKPVSDDDQLSEKRAMRSCRGKDSPIDKTVIKKESLDEEDSPVNSTSSQKISSGHQSPSTVSTCSSESTGTDLEKAVKIPQSPLTKVQKRVHTDSESDDKPATKKERSESPDVSSVEESSSDSGNEDGTNDGDLENNPDDDISPSPSTPCDTPSPPDNEIPPIGGVVNGLNLIPVEQTRPSIISQGSVPSLTTALPIPTAVVSPLVVPPVLAPTPVSAASIANIKEEHQQQQQQQQSSPAVAPRRDGSPCRPNLAASPVPRSLPTPPPTYPIPSTTIAKPTPTQVSSSQPLPPGPSLFSAASLLGTGPPPLMPLHPGLQGPLHPPPPLQPIRTSTPNQLSLQAQGRSSTCTPPPIATLQPLQQHQQQQQQQQQSHNHGGELPPHTAVPDNQQPAESPPSSPEPCRTPSPGPDPISVNEQIHNSKTALFIKILSRGETNSCSRCDVVFKPLPESKLSRKREERAKRAAETSLKIKEERDEKMQRRSITPPKNTSADAQVTSNVLPTQPHTPFSGRVTPSRTPGYPGHDTPALRQLSEYARPHALGQDMSRQNPYSLANLPPSVDPMLHYRMASMYPPGSRERLELELERDKRERDARERELRERELREMELREKMKAELEMKPPGFDRIPPGGSAGSIDPHWLELQRRYGPPGSLPPGAHPSQGHIPGVYPPSSLASDLMARERERLERLGAHPIGPLAFLSPEAYSNAVERLSQERMHAERMSAAGDPMARLPMGLSPHSAHTHTHAHSHTHLHLHPNEQALIAAGIHPQQHLFMPGGIHGPALPGADPMAGTAGMSQAPGGAPPHPMANPGAMPPNAYGPHALMASREQELLHRELLARSGYPPSAVADQALAHQLSAQAAHHEAMQRQLALERERLGGHQMPR